MNGTAELLDSPSPLLVDLVLLADKEDREPILSPETLEVDENELLVIVVGERETYHNPEIQRESLSACKQRNFQIPIVHPIVAGAVPRPSATPVPVIATIPHSSTHLQQEQLQLQLLLKV